MAGEMDASSKSPEAKQTIKLRQTDDRTHSILISEARAFAGMGVLSMQVVALLGGKSTIGHSGDWWQFLILSGITLGLVAWEGFRKKVKWIKCLWMVGMGLAVTWIMFSLVAISLSYKIFVGLALVLLVLSLLWAVFAMQRRVLKPVERIAESVEGVSSMMLACILLVSGILAYDHLVKNNIHSWYVEALPPAVLIVAIALTIAGYRKNVRSGSSLPPS